MKRQHKLILGVGIGLLALWAVFRFLFEGWSVNGDAMRPTYGHGDLLLGYKLAYSGPEDVQRGDVVVILHSPRGFQEYQVWRVRSLPGESVPLRDGSQSKLGSGEFFLLGDGPVALDSRSFGPVPFDRIQYKIVGRLVPAEWMGRSHSDNPR